MIFIQANSIFRHMLNFKYLNIFFKKNNKKKIIYQRTFPKDKTIIYLCKYEVQLEVDGLLGGYYEL